jgi:hypothetical protein
MKIAKGTLGIRSSAFQTESFLPQGSQGGVARKHSLCTKGLMMKQDGYSAGHLSILLPCIYMYTAFLKVTNVYWWYHVSIVAWRKDRSNIVSNRSIRFWLRPRNILIWCKNHISRETEYKSVRLVSSLPPLSWFFICKCKHLLVFWKFIGYK